MRHPRKSACRLARFPAAFPCPSPRGRGPSRGGGDVGSARRRRHVTSTRVSLAPTESRASVLDAHAVWRPRARKNASTLLPRSRTLLMGLWDFFRIRSTPKGGSIPVDAARCSALPAARPRRQASVTRSHRRLVFARPARSSRARASTAYRSFGARRVARPEIRSSVSRHERVLLETAEDRRVSPAEGPRRASVDARSSDRQPRWTPTYPRPTTAPR